MSEWVDDDHEQSVDLGVWKQLLGYTFHYKTTARTFLVVAFTLAASDLCFPLLTGTVIDAVIEDGARASLGQYGLMFLGLTLVLMASIWGFIACAGKLRTHISHDIRRDAFVRLQELSFSFFDTKPVGWLMARLTSDCNRLSNILAWGVMDFIWGISLMGGISIALFVMNWMLALAVLGSVPILFAVSVFFRKRMLRSARLVRKTNSRITANYNESITGDRTTKVFVRQQQNLSDFDRLADEMYGHSVRNSVLSAVYLPLVLAISSISIAAALTAGGYQLSLGNTTAGEIIMFMFYAQLFFQPVLEMSAWFAELQMAQASAERILGLVEAIPEVRDSEVVAARIAETGSDGHPDTIGRIEFVNVGFQYRTGPKIVEGFNLVVEPGQTIALVGATGGGKSTLVNLLCRFYEPTEGEILIDGVEYRDRGLLWLQSNLGIVLQQPHLFSGTIAENIRYGKLDATQEELEQAADVAGASVFIQELPNGYDTAVGEGGDQLSLGQKQLVSFARAVLKRPRLLVMDEATSSIDTVTEQQIQIGLERVLADRTSFVIAHRLSTIRSADQILVIDKGCVIERGTHSELLRNRGHYYALYTEQSMRDIVRIDTVLGSSSEPLAQGDA